MTTFLDVDIQPEPQDGFGGDIPPAFDDVKEPPKPPRAGSLQSRIEAMYATIAIAAMPFDRMWATTIIANAPACAEAWDALARESPAVKRMLEHLLSVSATGAVVAAHLPILLTAPYLRDKFGELFAMMTERMAHETVNETP